MKTHPAHKPYNLREWRESVLRSCLLAVAIILLALLVGVLGYHLLGGLGWVDAFLEASMILGGMGPVATMSNDAVKLFASFYALISGLMLVSTTGLLFAPWLQRLFYHTHRRARRDARAEEASQNPYKIS